MYHRRSNMKQRHTGGAIGRRRIPGLREYKALTGAMSVQLPTEVQIQCAGCHNPSHCAGRCHWKLPPLPKTLSVALSPGLSVGPARNDGGAGCRTRTEYRTSIMEPGFKLCSFCRTPMILTFARYELISAAE